MIPISSYDVNIHPVTFWKANSRILGCKGGVILSQEESLPRSKKKVKTWHITNSDTEGGPVSWERMKP